MSKFYLSSLDNVWLTADTHFNHKAILRYCKRPFSDVHDMNEKLIERWNAEVPKDGLVFHLGDFSFDNPKNFIPRLNGRIIIILGNHDHDSFPIEIPTHDILELRLHSDPKFSATLCHYPMMSWNHSHHGAYQFWGHHHGSVKPENMQPMSWDVGVDINGYRPMKLREAMVIAANHAGNMKAGYRSHDKAD